MSPDDNGKGHMTENKDALIARLADEHLHLQKKLGLRLIDPISKTPLHEGKDCSRATAHASHLWDDDKRWCKGVKSHARTMISGGRGE